MTPHSTPAPVGPTGEVDPGEPQRVEHGDQVTALLWVAVALRRNRRTPMAARVDRDYAKLDANSVNWCSNTSPDIVQPGTSTSGGPDPRSA